MLQLLSIPICIAGRYKLLLVGNCESELVRVVYDVSDTPILSSSQKEVMQSIVNDRLKRGMQIDRNINGSYPALYRLRDYTVNPDGGVTLSTGRTNYPEYLATNVEHPEWRSLYGTDVMSDALAFSVVLISSDGLTLFGRRSQKVADRRGELHVIPSGHPHPPASILEGLYAEIEEEAGIKPSEVSSLMCTGLLRNINNEKPELTYLVKSTLPMQQIVERNRTDAWEFAELFITPWLPDPVNTWLHNYVNAFVPPGHGALLLAGRMSFGTQWWEHNVRIFGKIL